MKKKLKISKKSKSQDWEILEDDIPIAKLGGNLEDNKVAYKAVQSKINEGVAKERKYREDVLKYANSVKDDKAFGQRVHDYVQQTCGKGNDCIAEATTYLKEAGYLDKVYTSNSHFQDDIKSGKLKNFSITPGNFINANTVKPADIVQTTHSIQDPNNPKRKFSGQPKHAMLVSKAQIDSIGNIAEFAYIGNQADAARTHGEYDRTSMMGSFGSGDFQIIKPDFVDQSLVKTRDSLTKEIQKEEPLFNKSPKLVRYNDMRPTKLTPANPGNYGALELVRIKDTQKMYQPIIDNQAELMKKYNLTQKEFVALLDNVIGVGEAESQQGSLMSPRYLAKQIPGAQFIGKLFTDDGKKAFDSGEYSKGPWQTKKNYVPDTSYERGSALEAFATMADRYKNQVPSQLKGTDAGYNEAVNKYKGIANTQNEYLKRVRDTDTFNIEVDGQTQELPKYIGRKQPTPGQPQQIMPELRNGGHLPMMPDGGRIPKAGDGKNMGYSWSTQQAPTQQVTNTEEYVSHRSGDIDVDKFFKAQQLLGDAIGFVNPLLGRLIAAPGDVNDIIKNPKDPINYITPLIPQIPNFINSKKLANKLKRFNTVTAAATTVSDIPKEKFGGKIKSSDWEIIN